MYKEDGSVFEIKESISPGDLPANIRKALDTKYSDGKLKKAEKITRTNIVEFEVLLENKEENMEVLINSSGKVLSQKAVSDEDEESEGDEPEED